jgi:hypothetical protein
MPNTSTQTDTNINETEAVQTSTTQNPTNTTPKGMQIPRLYTKAGEDPLEQIEYEIRSSIIKNSDGSIVKEIKNVEVPKAWSQVATDILAQKYFRKAGVPLKNLDGTPKVDENGKESHASASGYIFSDGEYFLNQLFARTFRFFSWNTYPRDGGQLDGTGRLKDDRMLGYDEYITVPTDVTEDANPIPKPPMIFPAVNCDANGRCIEDHTQTGVSINDIFDKDVIIPISSSRVFMRFYAFADADQMPLRGVTVDWGDGYKDPVLGMFRNHRGYKQPTCNKATKQCEITTTDDSKPCRADAQCGAGGKCILQTADSIIGTAIGKCVTPQTTGKGCEVDSDCDELVGICQGKDTAKSFGHIQDQSCDNDYIQFTHVYQCTRLPRANGGNFEPDPAKCGPRFPNGCCIFQPKVQVKDNWGWCSGKCTDVLKGGGGDGCYDGTFLERAKPNECAESAGAWVPFGKRVIVSPPPIRR